jgi:catechol 2,3-dioxygenase-like lactoylglutathione lyase family enzyme
MESPARSQPAESVDMKFEVAIIPVSDVDRAKSFYLTLGWRLDADFVRSDGSRAVQLTPPGSPSSIQLGSSPSARFYLVVNDIDAARADLAARGADVSEVFHRGDSRDSRVSGPRSGAAQLFFVCYVQRSGRQQLARSRGDATTARANERRHGDVLLASRPRGRASACRGRPWRT